MRYFGYEIYEIGDEGINHLAYNNIQEENITGVSVGSYLQFAHALMICSTLAELEIGANEHGIRFITWPEILASAPQETRFGKHPWVFPEVEISYQYPNGMQRQVVRAKPDSPHLGSSTETAHAFLVPSKPSAPTKSGPTILRMPHGSAKHSPTGSYARVA